MRLLRGTAGEADPVPGRPALRLGRRVSLVWRPRTVVVAVGGLAVTAAVLVASVSQGSAPVGLAEALRVLTGGGDETSRLIVLQLRLPRALTGALVGAALAVAGGITQTVARNPLASPDLLGITGGAAAGAVAVIVLGGSYGAVSGLLALVGVPLAALAGGLLSGLGIYLLAYRQGLDGYRLVLIGIAVNAMAVAVTSWLLVEADIVDAGRATVWLNGTLTGRGWEHVVPVSLALAVLVPAALRWGTSLRMLQLGDDASRALGVGVNRARTGLLCVAVALTSVATAAAGPIAFVALVAPQVTLRLARAPRPPLLASAATGAALTVTADLVARTAWSVPLPVGIVTAVLGAPFLLYLLARYGRKVWA